jgi:uncharacterized protein YjbI with pentapeptide repeats
MDASKIKEMRARWTIKNSVDGVSALTRKGASPFSQTEEGLIDLRGLRIVEMIKGVTVNKMDLSSILLEQFGQFSRCKAENVRLCSASLQTNIGDDFNFCDFTSSKMAGAILRGAFVDCDFSLVNMTSAMGSEVRFVRCVFFKTNFSKATLIHCLFEDCQFRECRFQSGSLSFSKFIRSPVRQESLGNTLMENVKFL